MGAKRASIVVDLRTGEHVVHVPDLVTVLAAAGWKTEIALKEYGGETLKLAKQAARKGSDLVIGYGGDGTLNAVVNGVMYAGGKSVVGVIPGGTYNEWAKAIEVSEDPVKAALSLIESEARRADLGHIEVLGLALPGSPGYTRPPTKQIQKQPKRSTKTRQYFLLHVGMGIDAAIMAHISKPLKYHIGPLAFELAAVKELPELHPFPVEVQVMSDNGGGRDQSGGAINRAPTGWQGEAWQVIVSKARYYGATVNVAPDAYFDDGLLHLCVITADTPIKSIEQAVSLLMRHKPDETTAKYFRGSHLSIRIPASIGMQVDGSVVKLEDYLRKAEREALKQAHDAGQVMVNYRFDAVSAAVPMAIPHEATRTLFQIPSHEEHPGPPPSQQKSAQAVQQVQREYQQRVEALQKQGYKVTVVGVVPHPTKTETYIVAGRYKKENTDETEVVAVRVNDRTLVLRQEGQDWASPAAVQELQEGDEIEVEGDKSKRGVIRARAVRLAH